MIIYRVCLYHHASATVWIVALTFRWRKNSSAIWTNESILHPGLKTVRVIFMITGCNHDFFISGCCSLLWSLLIDTLIHLYLLFLLGLLLESWLHFESVGADGACFIQHLIVVVYLVVIVEVIWNQLFWDHESRPEVALHDDENEKNCIDHHKNS